MEQIKFGAIDIGSNAVRLLIMSVSPEKGDESFNKELLIRVPLRLGQESFESGKIPESKRKKLIRTMKAFKHLMKVFDVEEYRACATAAMREASNSKEVIKSVKENADIKIEIIDGQEEAQIIYDSHFLYNLNDQHNYIFVDVGGGSTEISLISNGELLQSFSYKIGTVRMLMNKVDSTENERMRNDLLALKSMYEVKNIIASGGNIIKLNALSNTRKDRKLNIQTLENLNNELKQHTVDQLIDLYHLKADRADVITLAGDIYITVANTIGATHFIVPKTGLIDGIIHLLFEKWKRKISKKKIKDLEDFPTGDVENIESEDIDSDKLNYETT